MCRIKVSKDLYRGRRIRSINELKKLSQEGKSVTMRRTIDSNYFTRPSSFFLNWSTFALESLISRGLLFRTRHSLKDTLKMFFKKKKKSL